MTKTNVIILLQLFTKYKFTRENVESHSIWMRDYWINPWKNDIFYYHFIIKMSGPVSYLLRCLFSLFCSRSVCEAFRCSGSGFLSAWRLHYVQRVSISLPVVLIYLWISQWVDTLSVRCKALASTPDSVCVRLSEVTTGRPVCQLGHS